MITFMIDGRFFFEISPDKLLFGVGPWTEATETTEWKIAILPFKPLSGVSPRFLTASRWEIVDRAKLSARGSTTKIPALDWTPSLRKNFTRAFEDLQSLIQQNIAHKGVPFAWEQASFDSSPRLWENLLSQVKNLAPHLHAYGAELSDESVVGATPALLAMVAMFDADDAVEFALVTVAGCVVDDDDAVVDAVVG